MLADACGGLTAASHDLALRRMESAGARMTSWIQVLLELQRDWTRHETYDGAQTVLAGRDDGATFDYEAITRTPNTFLAHRVSWLAQREGQQRAFVEAALQAYFVHGRDIGSKGVLAEIASGSGLDRDAVAAFVSSDDGVERVRALERTALERGVQGVPYFNIGGTAIVGAQPAETILQTVIEAAARLAPRPAA